MAPSNRQPPSLNLLSTSSPARPVSSNPSTPYQQSQSPFRYVKESQTMDEKSSTQLSILSDEKRPAPAPFSPGVGPSRCNNPSLPASSPLTQQPSPFLRGPSPLLIPSHHRAPGQSQTYTRPRGLRISNLVKPWIPLILYGITSFGFLVAVAFWKNEVFEGLDELSHWLRVDEQFGYAALFLLIFLTTIPPFPLYSTLIILSGYTFGPWTGAIISYFAALSGALTVFILSRMFLRESISRWLSCTISIKRVVRAIEKRPKLLFLIRLAPYPYNVMNCLLAASSTLTLKTYTICTALSLFKVIIHTSLGASMHSFKDYHVTPTTPYRPDDGSEPIPEEDDSSDTLSRMWTITGISLCIAIFIYLSYVARRAVDDELDDDEPLPSAEQSEENVPFISYHGSRREPEADINLGRPMAESPFTTRLGFCQQPVRLGSELNLARDEEAAIGL